MDVERQLISKAVAAGTVEMLVQRGVSGALFRDDDNRAVFQTLVAHMRKYKSPPSREAVLAAHPGYKLDVVQDTTEYWLDKFIAQVKRRATAQALVDVSEEMEKNEEQDFDMLLMSHARRVAEIIPSSRVSKLSEAPNRLDLLRKQRELGRVPGFPLGIPTFDRLLLGVQAWEFVVIAAYSNVGKSTLLQLIALAGYLQSEQRPLFITLEMEGDELLRRFDAMAAKIQIAAISALDLKDGQEEKYENWAKRCASAPNDIIIIDDIESATVDRVLADTLRYKPSATFTDYIQLMDGGGENSYSRVGNVAKGLKKVARLTGIPQFTAAQTTRAGARDGVTSDNIADSIEIFRSADIMVGLERDEDTDAMRQARVKLIKSRRSKLAHTTINWNFDELDFSEAEQQNGDFKGKSADEPKAQDAFTPESRALEDNPFAIAMKSEAGDDSLAAMITDPALPSE